MPRRYGPDGTRLWYGKAPEDFNKADVARFVGTDGAHKAVGRQVGRVGALLENTPRAAGLAAHFVPAHLSIAALAYGGYSAAVMGVPVALLDLLDQDRRFAHRHGVLPRKP